MAPRTLANCLGKFLEENGFCVAVSPGICISGTFPGAPVEITVCGTLSRGDGLYELEIFSSHNSYEDMIATFGLRSLAGLRHITVKRLQQLYAEDKAGILCTVLNDRQTMMFRKKGNTTIVSDERDVVMEVIGKVYDTNETFIGHTLAASGVRSEARLFK